MTITTPPATQPLAWSADAQPPSIPLSTDATGAHTWSWNLTWNSFSAQGTASTPDGNWDAAEAAAAGGGTLSVTATCGADSATATVTITGTNPTPAQLAAFLATQPAGGGFSTILQHESGCRNFGHSGQPIVSFDKGYGIAQLTTPVPTFVQIWSWQQNVLGGLALFAQKQAAAKAYLGQGGRTFTDDQLLRESVCGWNGGHYHSWNGTAWVRNPNILCDPAGGNAGWNMADPANAGQTLAALHARDGGQFSGGHPPAGAHWTRFGVCYVDGLLGPPK